MVRRDDELELFHIHLPEHIFVPLGLHIFETRAGYPIDRILANLAILSILYPYSCKTHKISSKLGFVGFLMERK